MDGEELSQPLYDSIYKMKFFPFYVLITIFCVACFPEDKAVTPYDRTGLTTATIDVGSNYALHAFYSLQTHSIVRIEPYVFWDISFDCHPDSFGVFLNTAQLMGVYKVNASSFETIPNDTAFFANKWKYDSPSGRIDSSAIGIWWKEIKSDSVISKGGLYVTTLGVDANGKALGVKKFTLLHSTPTTYQIRFANLDGSEDTTMIIEKQTDYNVIGLSMRKKSIQFPEPPKHLWDLHFTRYTQLFTIVEEFPYPVTGVFINKSTVKAYLDTLIDFRVFDRNSIQMPRFTSQKDVIGYDWKTFDFTSAEFLVLPNKTYIIQSNNQVPYKLFFSDFYDEKTGSKGVIQFQYRTIE